MQITIGLIQENLSICLKSGVRRTVAFDYRVEWEDSWFSDEWIVAYLPQLGLLLSFDSDCNLVRVDIETEECDLEGLNTKKTCMELASKFHLGATACA